MDSLQGWCIYFPSKKVEAKPDEFIKNVKKACAEIHEAIFTKPEKDAGGGDIRSDPDWLAVAKVADAMKKSVT